MVPSRNALAALSVATVLVEVAFTITVPGASMVLAASTRVSVSAIVSDTARVTSALPVPGLDGRNTWVERAFVADTVVLVVVEDNVTSVPADSVDPSTLTRAVASLSA